jgi:hypothetical protein
MMNTLKINQPENLHKTSIKSANKMEAIARGVQARFDDSIGYSKKVTDETINIARSLGVSNSEIERWAASRTNRLAHDRERLQEIKSLLDKAYVSGLNNSPARMRG